MAGREPVGLCEMLCYTWLWSGFLPTVRGKTGILVERGKQRYGFLHLTFEEYFAAKELAVQKKTRVDFIKQHLHDVRWREVILLSIGSVGILEADEEGVTELVQEAILHANSDFERWLYRDLLFAGLCLADDVGVSITCEEEILQQIVYRYLTSAYDSFRTACVPVLNAWRDTSLAERVVPFMLPLLHEQQALMDRTQPEPLPSTLSATKLQEQIRAFCLHFIQQSQKSFIRLLRLQVASILLQSRVSRTVEEWLEYAITALTDPSGEVRLAAATVLGQVGAGDQRVVDALLKLLSDPDPSGEVHQAAATALGQVGAGDQRVVDALLKLLSDPDPDPYGEVRLAAATALGQVGAGDQRVVDALLKLLSDPDPNPFGQVHQAAATALVILSVDALTLGRRVEEMLHKYEPIISKQFTVDDVADSLLSALQQIVGEV